MGATVTFNPAGVGAPPLSVTRKVKCAVVALQSTAMVAVTTPVPLILRLLTVTPLSVALAASLIVTGNVFSASSVSPTIAMTAVALGLPAVRLSVGDVIGGGAFTGGAKADSFVEENSLNKNIWAWRRVLGEEESFIETIPKRGYRFLAAVREADSSNQSTMMAQRTRTNIVSEEEFDDKPLASKIAVLPFRNLGEGAHLGLGLADTLITRLSNLRLIQVRPTASIIKYTTHDCDALAAGRELQVDAVLFPNLPDAGVGAAG